MKEYVPLTSRAQLSPPAERRIGVWEVEGALSPHQNETHSRGSAFYSADAQEKLGIIDAVYTLQETRDTTKRREISDRLIREFIKDPERCVTFFQTLRDYESANPEGFGPVANAVRSQIWGRVEKVARQETASFLKLPAEMQEERMGKLLHIMLFSVWPDMKGEEAETRGIIEGGLMLRRALRGLISGTKGQDDIVQLMYSLTVGGLSQRNDHLNALVYRIMSFAYGDIFDISDPQAGHFVASSFSLNDETFAKMTLLDYTATVLEKLYEQNAGRLDGLRDILMRRNKTFLQSIEKAVSLLRNGGKTPEEQHMVQKIKAKMDFLQEKQRTNIDCANELSEDDNAAAFIHEADYPTNIVAGPYKLRILYNELLSRHLMARGQIESPIITVSLPSDGTLRNIERTKGAPDLFAEQVLRLAYTMGEPKDVLSPYIIADALTYLKPHYDADDGLFTNAKYAFRIEESRRNKTPMRTVHVTVTLGNYRLPVVLDMAGRIRFENGGMIELPEEKRAMWEHSITEAYRLWHEREIKTPLLTKMSAGEKVVIQKDVIELTLSSLRPPVIPSHKYAELVQLRRKKHALLDSPEEAYGLHAYGNRVPITNTRLGCGTTQMFFNWGKGATTDVELHIGSCRLRMKLDIHYNLVHADGSPLNVDAQTKTWWESVILSHLSDLLTIPRSGEKDAPFGNESESRGNKRRPVTPHRRLLEVGKHARRKQSEFIERVNGDDDDPRKIPLRISVPPGEHLLQTWNKMLGRDGLTPDTREYTWVLPSDNAISGYTLDKNPVTKALPHAFRDLENIHIV